MEIFPRITVDPNLCTGKPCIRGSRFPVSRLLGLLAAGETKQSILEEYPYLEAEDVDAALRYAASLAEDETVELTRGHGALAAPGHLAGRVGPRCRARGGGRSRPCARSRDHRALEG